MFLSLVLSTINVEIEQFNKWPCLILFSSTCAPHCGQELIFGEHVGQTGTCWQGLSTTCGEIVFLPGESKGWMKKTKLGTLVKFETTSDSNSLHSWHFPNTVVSSTYLGVISTGVTGFILKLKRWLFQTDHNYKYTKTHNPLTLSKMGTSLSLDCILNKLLRDHKEKTKRSWKTASDHYWVMRFGVGPSWGSATEYHWNIEKTNKLLKCGWYFPFLRATCQTFCFFVILDFFGGLLLKYST